MINYLRENKRPFDEFNNAVVYVLWVGSEPFYVGASTAGLSRISAHVPLVRKHGVTSFSMIEVPKDLMFEIEAEVQMELNPILKRDSLSDLMWRKKVSMVKICRKFNRKVNGNYSWLIRKHGKNYHRDRVVEYLSGLPDREEFV